MAKTNRIVWRPLKHGAQIGVPETAPEENRLTELRDRRPLVVTIGVSPRRRSRIRMFLVCGVIAIILLSGISYAMWRSRTQTSVATSVASVAPRAMMASAENVTATSAIIRWTTDQPLTSQVAYGPSPAYGSLSAFHSPPVTAHSVALNGLIPGMTYNFQALSTGSNGESNRTGNATFSTPAMAGTPLIDQVSVSDIAQTSATVTWTTDQPGASQLEYGVTSGYGSLSAFNPALTTSHMARITGLAPGTTYDAAALSANSAGQVGTSANFTFSTSGLGGAPIVSPVTVSDVTATSGRLTWTTDQLSTSQVEYGATIKYGSLSAFNAVLATSHSITLTGLIPGTTYNSSALSANGNGQVGRSADTVFTTVGAPPLIRQMEVSRVSATSATISWITDQPSSSQVAYGGTTGYGSLSPASPALVTSHSIQLSGLKPGTTYNASATSANALGMQNSSSNLKFVTR